MADINATLTNTIITATVTNDAEIAASLGVSTITATVTSGDDITATVTESPVTATLVNGGSISASITESPITATIILGLDDAPSDGSTYGRQDAAWVVVEGGDISEGGTGGVVGRVAEFVTDDKTLQAAALIAPAVNILTLTNAAPSTLAMNITAGKTLTLTAADNYTLTIPATGTAALLATANVYTAIQTVQGAARSDPATSGSTQSAGHRLRLETSGSSAVMDFGIATSGQGWIQTPLKSNLATNQDLLLNLNGGAVLVGTKTNYGVRFVAEVSAGNAALFSSRAALSTTSGAGVVAISTLMPTATNQRLGFLNFGSAKGGTAFSTGARIDGFAEGAWSDGVSYPTYISFLTTPSGSTAPVERLRIESAGLSTFTLDSAATNSVVNVANFLVSSTGTAAAGLGAGLLFSIETATASTNQNAGAISASWVDATNADRKAKLSLSAYDTAARLGIEIEASGSAVKLGFFGGTTAIQQVLNAYTSDGEGAAYTGIDNAQVGTVYATVADLNTLRVAYETLRASYDDLRTKLQTSTLVA